MMTPPQKWYLDLREEKIFFCSCKNGKKLCHEEKGCVTSVSLSTHGKALVKVSILMSNVNVVLMY